LVHSIGQWSLDERVVIILKDKAAKQWQIATGKSALAMGYPLHHPIARPTSYK
jgi:hypothetical protein